MTDTTDDTETRMTRRDALKGGSAAAVAAGSFLLQQQLVQRAAAQTTEPRIQLGSDWVIDDDPDGNGAFVIEHTPNGNEYVFAEDGTVTGPQILPTNQSSFKASKESGSDQSLSAMTAETVEFSNEVYDNQDEFAPWDGSSGSIFNPSETGIYIASASVRYDIAADGDQVFVVIADLTQGLSLGITQIAAGSSAPVVVNTTTITELQAGNDIVVRARNGNSDDTILSGSETYFAAYRIA